MIFENGPDADVPRYTLYPAIELDGLAFQDRSTTCWVVAPKPLADSGAKVELLVKNEMFAEAEPVAVGAKVRVKGTLCPATRVIGNVSPPTVNAELLELVDDSVTLPPEAVTLPPCVWVVPIVTLPKLIEPGVTASVPFVVVPMPLRETFTLGSDPFEASVRVALSVPDVLGEKVTDRFALAPAARLEGKLNPRSVKSLPPMVAPESVRLDPPVFVTVSVCVWLLPTGMLPRFILDGALRYPGPPVPAPERVAVELPE